MQVEQDLPFDGYTMYELNVVLIELYRSLRE